MDIFLHSTKNRVHESRWLLRSRICKKLQTFYRTLNSNIKNIYAPSKEIFNEGVGLTAVKKIFNKNLLGIKNTSY